MLQHRFATPTGAAHERQMVRDWRAFATGRADWFDMVQTRAPVPEPHDAAQSRACKPGIRQAASRRSKVRVDRPPLMIDDRRTIGGAGLGQWIAVDEAFEDWLRLTGKSRRAGTNS
jgi:hypothetical protein